MNTERNSAREPANGSFPTYAFTFGVFNQIEPWIDVRKLSWPELAALLTDHKPGAKKGTCIVPAVFSSSQRRKADAQRIEVAFLDSDTGVTLEEIAAAVSKHDWAAVVSSTHSHLTTTTRAKRVNWDKFRDAATEQATAASAFLRDEKGYLPHIAAGARVLAEGEDAVVFEHQPAPKFRIAIPLQRPWMAAEYKNQCQANTVWKERIEALAAALHLNHDQACTDTSRLFYLPRRPANGPAPETAVLDGMLCDLFALPRASQNSPNTAGTSGRNRGRTASREMDYAEPDTGEVHSLATWAAHYANRFEIAKALKARRPDVFVGKLAEGGKHHIRCANEQAHTQAGADAATIVINASESTNQGFVYHCRHAHCDGTDRLFFVRQMLEQGWLSYADLHNPNFLADRPPPKRRIRVVLGQLAEVVDQAEQALLEASLGLYQRGSFIVRPGYVRVAIANKQEAAAQRILEVEEYALVEAMTTAADWEHYDGRRRAWVTIDAPMRVAVTFRQRVGRWRLPVLTGIINAPTLRADGSILSAPGYDCATGLLLDTGEVRFPAVPEQPTRSDAVAALQLLDELVATFPFVDPPSRAVAISAVLTACIRRSLPSAPMHGFTAPMAGSGKSKLVDLASLIGNGRQAGVLAQGSGDEELEKRLSALLLAGDPVIAIDNCEVPLGGEFLCCMLTQRVVRARILGRSEAPELPANAFVTATGNNLVLVGDMTRRTIMCRLDPKHERPELRQFSTDPTATVKAERGRYVVAALTVLRAYQVAGRPGQPSPLGSFEEWSNWIRGALLWLGQADPVATMDDVRETDPKLDALTAVLEQWHAIIGGATVSARAVIERATQQRHAVGVGSLPPSRMEFVHPDFREALLTIAGEGGVINGKRLGKWLASHQERIVQGKRLIRNGLSEGVVRWRLEASVNALLNEVP